VYVCDERRADHHAPLCSLERTESLLLVALAEHLRHVSIMLQALLLQPKSSAHLRRADI